MTTRTPHVSSGRLTAALIIAAAALAAAGPAAAAPRYATPTGTAANEPCATPQSPCDVVTAVHGAQTGDDVYVEGDLGPYTLSTLVADNGVTIHVHAYKGRPTLNFSTGGFALHASSTAEDLSLTKTGSGTLLSLNAGASADRIVAKASGGDHACYLTQATLNSSVCWTTVSTSLGVVETDNSNTFRNDTIYTAATDSTLGVEAFGRSSAPNATDTFVNTVARGGSGGVGVQASSDGTADITVDLSFSNATTATAGAGSPTHTHVVTDASDQTTTPSFADPGNGDFHELAASPTIDAGGAKSTCTATDLDGHARPDRVEQRCDIGAFEFLDPLDRSAPAIALAAPAAGAHYKQGQHVTASYTCTDPDGAADVAFCQGPAPNGGSVDTSSVGDHAFTVQAHDQAGNASTKTVHYTVDSTESTPPAVKGFPPSQGCVAHGLKLKVSVHPTGLKHAAVFLDGTKIKTSKKPKFKVRVAASKIKAGRHKLLIVRTYKSGTKRKSTFSFARCRGGGKSPHIRTQGTPDRGTCTAHPFKIVVTVKGAKPGTIVVKLDRKPFAKPTTSPFTLNVDPRKLAAGPHRLTIQAADKFGNSSTSFTDFVRCA